MSVRVEHGDCLEVMARLVAEGVRVDAVVTDPPYGLGFMGKAWDSPETVAFRAETWALAMSLLKPGAHLVAFSGTRTYHRMACAIEDAGFDVRDQLAWVYGSGFPKSHDISKAIDKAAGAERDVVGLNPNHRPVSGVDYEGVYAGGNTGAASITAPATEAARQWQGWGTALKPSWEPVVLARKPIQGTVAANVLAHGTGGLNIDATRIAAPDGITTGGPQGRMPQPEDWQSASRIVRAEPHALGRWPANIVHDGSPEVLAGFPETGVSAQGATGGGNRRGGFAMRARERDPGLGDSGSAARFFYTAKADAADRLGSKHPTVKPVDLMAWLCRLVTPPGGLILDPFAGSGTTGMAAMREGFDAILIEREAEYVADIKRRLAHVKGEDAPLFAGGAL